MGRRGRLGDIGRVAHQHIVERLRRRFAVGAERFEGVGKVLFAFGCLAELFFENIRRPLGALVRMASAAGVGNVAVLLLYLNTHQFGILYL
jgi:hypothetical protein